MRDDETTTIEQVKAVRETGLALLCKLHDGREVWVPQSQIHDDSEVFSAGHFGRLVVAQWFAEKEGLE